MKEKELDKWYEENRELPELNDYERTRGWSWGDGGYEGKLKVYCAMNPDSIIAKTRNPQDPMGYKPKLGEHSLCWTLYNKYHDTPQWNEARENLLKMYKEGAKCI